MAKKDSKPKEDYIYIAMVAIVAIVAVIVMVNGNTFENDVDDESIIGDAMAINKEEIASVNCMKELYSSCGDNTCPVSYPVCHFSQTWNKYLCCKDTSPGSD